MNTNVKTTITRPSVTVICTVFRRLGFLEEALTSVASQTYTDYTVLIGDASGQPETNEKIAAIVASVSLIDVTIVHHAQPLSQLENFRALVSQSDTEYIAVLDDDDIWMGHHLQQAVDFMDAHPAIGITLSNSVLIDQNGVGKGNSKPPDDPLPTTTSRRQWARYLLSRMYSSNSSIVARRDALSLTDITNISIIDRDVVLKAILKGARGRAFAEPSIYYRFHQASFYPTGGHISFRRVHKWRVELLPRYGLQIVTLCPAYLALVIKSKLYLLRHREDLAL